MYSLGSILAARQAGTAHAVIATPASSAITPRYVTGSRRRNAKQHRDDGLGRRDRAADADRDAEPGERHPLADDQREDVPARRAQRRAHPDLAGPLGHAAGEHAVDAGGREHQRRERERLEQISAKRRSAADAATRSSMVATRTIGWSLSTDQTARRTAGARAAASPRARTTSDIALSAKRHWLAGM